MKVPGVGVFVLLATAVGGPGGVWALWGGEEGMCGRHRSFPDLQSDVYITGLLGIHGGARCGLVDPAGVQLMEAARWSAHKLNENNFVPGVTLGVNLFDTCGGPDAAVRAGVSAMVEGGFLDDPECDSGKHVGVLHTHPDNDNLVNFLEDVGVPSVSVGSPDLSPQLEALMPLLQRINWTSIAVAAPSVTMLREFGNLAANARICVSAEAILPYNSDQASYREVLETLGSGKTRGVVLLGPQDKLHATLTTAAAYNLTDFDWILAPTGPIQEHFFQGLNKVGTGLLAVRRASQSVPKFGQHFLDISATDSTLYPSSLPDDYVEEPAVFQVVEAMFKMGAGVRRAVLDQCGGSGWCSNASVVFTDPHTDGLDVIEALSIKTQRPRYQVLQLTATEEARLVFQKVGYYSADVLDLDRSVLEGPNKPRPHPCRSCRCLNVGFAFLIDLRWRTNAWVTICATTAIIGILLAVAIFVFVASRSCRGRAPEGSQAFTLLLLVSCVLLYSAILPYSFEASSLTCALRPFVTSLTYAIVYSIMLARSLMLATADSEGLVGHVSGLVQTALLFFMVSVQAGLGVQQWVMNPPHTAFLQPPSAKGILYTCSGDRLYFIVSQSYVMFLLLLQLLVSPFIVRSRRNYHEGLLYFLATLLMAGVWVGWATLFMLLPPVWSDACICLGLAATPTALLLTVFIPKTYLMVRASARESACATPIRPISRPQSVHDLPRVSSLALYDSISHLPEMSYAQVHAPSHAYTPDPTAHLGHKESPYEAYSHYQPSATS